VGHGPARRPDHAGPAVPRRLHRRRRSRPSGFHPLSGLTGHLFDADGRDSRVELTAEVVRSLGPKKLLWLDVDRRDEATLTEALEVLGLEHADVDRLRDGGTRARLTRATGHIHITLDAMEVDDGSPPSLVRREIDLLAAKNVVLTVHEGPVAALERFGEGLEGETRLGQLTAADLLSALVDEVLVGYFLLVELIEREIDDLDQRALHGRAGDDILSAIVKLRRRIGLVRRTLAPHRDALSSLGLPELGIEDTIGRPWPGLVDRLESALAAIESLRDGLLGTFDIHMGRVSQRANDVMRTLTLLSAVLLPAVVLAGVMGMNFKLGFFEDATNFWLVIGGMAAFALAIVTVARVKRWL
jgi:magnesium transporter